MRMSMSTMPTFTTEALHLTTTVLNNCYSEVTAYTTLAYSIVRNAYGCLDHAH